jgi:membrane associated rhomboid family serine protease
MTIAIIISLLTLIYHQTALQNVGRNVAINLMYGFSSSNVDNGAHIGGFLAGALFTYLFGPRYSLITK